MLEVAHDLHGIYSTQETCARPCKVCGSHPATLARSYRSYREILLKQSTLDNQAGIDDISELAHVPSSRRFWCAGMPSPRTHRRKGPTSGLRTHCCSIYIFSTQSTGSRAAKGNVGYDWGSPRHAYCNQYRPTRSKSFLRPGMLQWSSGHLGVHSKNHPKPIGQRREMGWPGKLEHHRPG